MAIKNVSLSELGNVLSTPFIMPSSRDLIKTGWKGDIEKFSEKLWKYRWPLTRDYTMAVIILTVVIAASKAKNVMVSAKKRDENYRKLDETEDNIPLSDYINKKVAHERIENLFSKIVNIEKSSDSNNIAAAISKADKPHGWFAKCFINLLLTSSNEPEKAEKVFENFLKQVKKMTKWEINQSYMKDLVSTINSALNTKVREEEEYKTLVRGQLREELKGEEYQKAKNELMQKYSEWQRERQQEYEELDKMKWTRITSSEHLKKLGIYEFRIFDPRNLAFDIIDEMRMQYVVAERHTSRTCDLLVVYWLKDSAEEKVLKGKYTLIFQGYEAHKHSWEMTQKVLFSPKDLYDVDGPIKSYTDESRIPKCFEETHNDEIIETHIGKFLKKFNSIHEDINRIAWEVYEHSGLNGSLGLLENNYTKEVKLFTVNEANGALPKDYTIFPIANRHTYDRCHLFIYPANSISYLSGEYQKALAIQDTSKKSTAMTQLKEKIEKDLKYLNISKLDGLQLVPVQDKKLKEIEKKLSETPQPGYWERFIAPFWAAEDEREDYKDLLKQVSGQIDSLKN